MAISKFPQSQAEVMELAQELKTGLENNSTVYPAPPIDPTGLQGLIVALQNAENAITETRAIAKAATEAKAAALEALATAMKKDIRYAEDTVNYDDAKLNLIGWAKRKPAEPMVAPGQAVDLVVTEQGEGWLSLQWKKPVDGGAVATYRVYRRLRAEGDWQLIESPLSTTITLLDQTRGIEWEYRVSAVNKAGQGLPSNTVFAVL
jgi:hypothetical protein